MRIALLVVIGMLAPIAATAHPGPVSKDGCHVCRHRCEAFGLAPGQRHCHPERLDALPGGGRGKTGRADDAGGPGAGSRMAIERQEAFVTKVSDGDTFVVRTADGEDRIRVLGIDCPESARNAKCQRDGRQGRAGCDAQVPRGLDAKRYAKRLVEGRTVTLEGPFSRDPFGRRLAYIRLEDGRDYGLVMVREGRCEDFGWKYPHPRSAAYRGATP